MISDSIKQKFIEADQSHIFTFEKELTETEILSFQEQLNKVDINLAQKLFKLNEEICISDFTVEPLPCVVEAELSPVLRKEYISEGTEIMKRGEYAVVTMAGGQGTRLGHKGPKGTFYVNVPEPVSLFEIQCNRIKRQAEACGRNIPWYIMTSEENDSETQKFFADNNFFGYPKEDIFFFKQYMLPMLDVNGKLILETKSKIKEGVPQSDIRQDCLWLQARPDTVRLN